MSRVIAVPRVVRGRGFGAYPTDACYDPTRPTWLPYWLDDLTESDCKYQSDNILTASLTAIANPDVVASNVGGVIGQGAGSAVSDIGADVAAGIQAAAGGAAGGVANTIDMSGLALIGAGLLFLFLMVKK